jgi:hypothetical protein
MGRRVKNDTRRQRQRREGDVMATHYCRSGDGTSLTVDRVADVIGVKASDGGTTVFVDLDPRAFAADVLAAAGGATMTAREAADAFYVAWMNHPSVHLTKFACEWFEKHWPADRHAPAATGGGVQVVEVTAEDYAASIEEHWSGTVPGIYALRADHINARLRARAVPADAPGWVSRPKGQAGALPPMPDEPVVVCFQSTEPKFWESGLGLNKDTIAPTITRWCLHSEFNASFDGVTPIPWRVRQPATPGGWTAETVPQVGEVGVLYRADGTVINDGSVIFEKGGAELAELWNRVHSEVAAYVKVPSSLPITPERGA